MADKPLKMSDRPRGWNDADERRFKTWYARVAKEFGLDPNPDNPRHHYNYRHAFKKGAWPDQEGHWPSEYKDASHPNRFVEGKDTLQTAARVQPSGYRDLRAEERRALPGRDFQLPQGVANTLRDVGIWGLNAAMGLPEAIVGIADIPTLGRTGKFLEETVGFRPGEARQILARGYSPTQQEAQRQLDEAQGFTQTLGTLAQNPRLVAQAITESAPQMLGGAGAARMMGTKLLSPLARIAIGEGLMAAGAQAENIRTQTPERTLTPTQAGLATLTGMATGGVTAGGGRVAEKLGLTDIDTLLANLGRAGSKTTARTAAEQAASIAAAAAAEGAEEFTQESIDRITENLALERPWYEGVPEAGAMGLVTGGVMGGGAQAATRPQRQPTLADVAAPVQPVNFDALPEVAPADWVPGRAAADERAASRAVAMDQPINAMADISGAAMRMRNEDPDIIRKAQELQNSAQLAKQALDDQKKGRGPTATLVSPTQTVPAQTDEFGQPLSLKTADELGLRVEEAPQPPATAAFPGGISEPRFKGWQEQLPGEPPIPLYDWPIDEQGRYTTGTVEQLQQAGFTVPLTPQTPGVTQAQQTPTRPLRQRLASEVGALGDFIEDQYGRPVPVGSQENELDRLIQQPAAAPAAAEMAQLLDRPLRAEAGGETAVRQSVIDALVASGNSQEKAAQTFSGFQKQANKAGKAVNVWADEAGKRFAAMPFDAKGGAPPFEGARLVSRLEPQAGPPLSQPQPASEPAAPAMTELPEGATGLARLRSRIERSVLPQVTKPIPAGRLRNLIKAEGVNKEEFEFTGLDAWLQQHEADNKDVTPESLTQFLQEHRLPVFEKEYSGGHEKWRQYELEGDRADTIELVMKWPEFQTPSASPAAPAPVVTPRQVVAPEMRSDDEFRNSRVGPYEYSRVAFDLPDGTRSTAEIFDYTKTDTRESITRQWEQALGEADSALKAVMREVIEKDPAYAAQISSAWGMMKPRFLWDVESRRYDAYGPTFRRKLNDLGVDVDVIDRHYAAQLKVREAYRPADRAGLHDRADKVDRILIRLKELDEAATSLDGVTPVDEAFRQYLLNPPLDVATDGTSVSASDVDKRLRDMGYSENVAYGMSQAVQNLVESDNYYNKKTGGVFIKGPAVYDSFHHTVEEALDNYREQALAEYVGRNQPILENLNFAQTGHYPDKNPIGHLRTNLRTIKDTPTRFVDEMQADLHKAATKPPARGKKGVGYRDAESLAQFAEKQADVETQARAFFTDLNQLVDEINAVDPDGRKGDPQSTSGMPRLGEAHSQSASESLLNYHIVPEIALLKNENIITPAQAQGFLDRRNELATRSETLRQAQRDRDAVKLLDKLPNIPYKGRDWVSLMLRRAISLAVDKGERALGLTTGVQQSKRWNDLLENIQSFTRTTQRDGTHRFQFRGNAVSEEQLDEVADILRADDRTEEAQRFEAWRKGADPNNPDGITEVEEGGEEQEEVTEDDIDRSDAPWSMSEVEQEPEYVIQDGHGNVIEGGFESQREAERAMERMDSPAYTSEEERWVLTDSEGDTIERIVNARGERLDDGEGRFTSEEDAEEALEEWKRQNPDEDEDSWPTVEQGDSVYIVRDREGHPIDDEEFDNEDDAYTHMDESGYYYRVEEQDRDPQWEVYNPESGDSEYFDSESDAEDHYTEQVDEWVREQVEEQNRERGITPKTKREVTSLDFVFDRPLTVGARGYTDVYDRRAINDLTQWLKPYGVKPEKVPIKEWEITGGAVDPLGRTTEKLDEELKAIDFQLEAARKRSDEAWDTYEKFRQRGERWRTAEDTEMDWLRELFESEPSARIEGQQSFYSEYSPGPTGPPTEPPDPNANRVGFENPAQGELFDTIRHAIQLEEDYYKVDRERSNLLKIKKDLKEFRATLGNYEVRPKGARPGSEPEASFKSREEAEKYKTDKENTVANTVWWVELPEKFIEDVKKYGLPLMAVPLAAGLAGGDDEEDEKKTTPTIH